MKDLTNLKVILPVCGGIFAGGIVAIVANKTFGVKNKNAEAAILLVTLAMGSIAGYKIGKKWSSKTPPVKK